LESSRELERHAHSLLFAVFMAVPRQNSGGVLSFTPLTMLQASAQAVDFKVGRHFGEGQGKVYYSIRRNLFANLPESATSGEHGVVVVRLHIQKDGSLPDKFMTIVSSSGKEDMDGAALSAIRSAGHRGSMF